ncbi:MAG: hypothetical protein GY853_01270 [PVC group bacterium]|nr:hypothetical protein [PVC group bacterium]
MKMNRKEIILMISAIITSMIGVLLASLDILEITTGTIYFIPTPIVVVVVIFRLFIKEVNRHQKELLKESKDKPYFVLNLPEYSKWTCYLWGCSTDGSDGISYTPTIDNVPNWFIRWMMKICFACTWVKGE